MTDRQVSTVLSGGDRKPYIVRPETTAFLEKLGGAIAAKTGPRLFQVWGVGGVGKTTVLTKAEEALADQAICSRVSFGVTDGIESPMGLMEKLAEPLARDDRGSEFAELMALFRKTLTKLKEQPPGKGITEEQKKSFLELIGSVSVGFVKGRLSDEAGQDLDSIKDKLIDASTDAVLGMAAWLKQHQATKMDEKLQELMMYPEQKLTTAFATLLRDQRRPVLLLLDTYEKAPLEVDTWLWRTLVANQDCGAENLGQVRILVAGRNSLVDEREGWRKLQQDRDCIAVLGLDRFNLLQTQRYLKESGITNDAEIEQIYGVTKGLPYYLNWIRKEVQAGRKPDFSRGNEDIAKLLLQGLSGAQQRLIEVAACFRQFKRKTLERVLAQLKAAEGLDLAAAVGEKGAFDWLTDREAMQFVEKREGHYRLDDVARDVFRMALFEADEELFRAVQGLIAADYLAASQRVEPEDAGYAARHENVDWRKLRSAYLYHLFLSNDREASLVFQRHLLEAQHFGMNVLVQEALRNLLEEFELDQHPLLSDRLRRFLIKLRPEIEHWIILERDPVNELPDKNTKLLRQQIDTAKQASLQNPDKLGGLAQFLALLGLSKNCSESQRARYLDQASVCAEGLIDPGDLNFSSNLYSSKLGNYFFFYGKYNEALKSFNTAIKMKYDSYQAWNNRGVTLKLLERKEDAIDSYRKAIEINSDCFSHWNNMGNLLGELEKYREALESFDKAIEIEPNAFHALIKRGEILYLLGQYERALQSFDRAAKVKPDIHNVWYKRGIVLQALRRYKEALENFNKAVEINPTFYPTWIAVGNLFYTLRKYEEAIDSYGKAIKIEPNAYEAWHDQGVSLKELGRYKAAIANFFTAIRIKPDLYSAWNSWGNVLNDLGQHETAIRKYREAIKIQPKFHFSWYGIGLAFLHLHDYDNAFASFNRVLKIKPDRYQAWDSRGVALSGLEQYEEAVFSYNKALKIKPDYASALYNKACAHALNSQPDPALQALSQAIALNPNDYRSLAQTDSDFDSLRPDPRFQQLLTPESEPLN